MKKDVLFCTVSTLQDVRIVRYEQMISSTAVIGTALLSELRTSFSDMFGLSGKAAEEKIGSIKQTVLQDLRQQALRCGCNVILGLHLDVDELASGGLNMYMITASGTPAQAEFSQVARSHLDGARVKQALENRGLLARADQIRHLKKPSVTAEFDSLCAQILSENAAWGMEKTMADLCVDLLLNNQTFCGRQTQAMLSALDPETFGLCVLQRLKENSTRLEDSRLLCAPSEERQVLLECLAQNVPWEFLEKEMAQEDIALQSLVLLPALMPIKDTYTAADIPALEGILKSIRKSWWTDQDIEKEEARIDRSGHVVQFPAEGTGKTISAATLKRRKQQAARLERILHILRQNFA